jgi:hypothetical protein
MWRGMKLKKINFKKSKNEDQTHNKYKVEDTIKFLRAWHKHQGPGERNEWQGKNIKLRRTIAHLVKHVTLTAMPQPLALNETAIGFFYHLNCSHVSLE